MPIKYFCDVCEKETNENVINKRLEADPFNYIQIQIVCGTKEVFNWGVLCQSCLIQEINKLWGDNEIQNNR